MCADDGSPRRQHLPERDPHTLEARIVYLENALQVVLRGLDRLLNEVQVERRAIAQVLGLAPEKPAAARKPRPKKTPVPEEGAVEAIQEDALLDLKPETPREQPPGPTPLSPDESRRERLKARGWHPAAGTLFNRLLWRSPGGRVIDEEEAFQELEREERKAARRTE